MGYAALIPIPLIIILAILVILMPVCVYTAQKWAYKRYKELVKLNKNIELRRSFSE